MSICDGNFKRKHKMSSAPNPKLNLIPNIVLIPSQKLSFLTLLLAYPLSLNSLPKSLQSHWDVIDMLKPPSATPSTCVKISLFLCRLYTVRSAEMAGPLNKWTQGPRLILKLCYIKYIKLCYISYRVRLNF